MPTRDNSKNHKNWLAKPGNKEKAYEATRRWKQTHKEECRFYRHVRRLTTAQARVEKRIDKKKIYNWSSRICGICDLLIEGDFHIDHIIPLSKGGQHSTANLQLAHTFCNKSKFNKLPSESGMVL